MIRDHAGHAVTGATPAALAHYEHAMDQFRCFSGDPAAAIEASIAEAPGMAMAHVAKAWLYLLGTEPTGLPVARACQTLASELAVTERERGHVAAITHLVEGRWRAAARVLEDVSIHSPLDTLALQAGHQLDFFTGDSRMLHDRIARALPTTIRAAPGYHAVLGMLAFGLEETGRYAHAEAFGRRCVELEPRDAWGHHAVAHVMEMQGRKAEGVAWLRGNKACWSTDNFFAVHNWWHLALFHLAQGDTAEVLALLDGPIGGTAVATALDLIDASALLWRLHLLRPEIALRQRWRVLAQR